MWHHRPGTHEAGIHHHTCNDGSSTEYGGDGGAQHVRGNGDCTEETLQVRPPPFRTPRAWQAVAEGGREGIASVVARTRVGCATNLEAGGADVHHEHGLEVPTQGGGDA